MSTEVSPAPLAPISIKGWLAYSVALGAVVIDQASKFWILYVFDLPARFSVPVLPPVFALTMVPNPGVSFGLFKADSPFGRTMLSLFAAVVVLAIAWFVRRADKKLTAVALGLVMGGALGNNLIDRVRLGHVTDFLDFSGLGFFPWVFNVADACITIGVALLMFEAFTTRPSPAKAAT